MRATEEPELCARHVQKDYEGRKDSEQSQENKKTEEEKEAEEEDEKMGKGRGEKSEEEKSRGTRARNERGVLHLGPFCPDKGWTRRDPWGWPSAGGRTAPPPPTLPLGLFGYLTFYRCRQSSQCLLVIFI